MNKIVVVGSSDCPLVAFDQPGADVAVAWLKTLLGLLNPEQFLKIVAENAPHNIGLAQELVKVCLGVGA